jgi:ribonuclease HII
MDQTYDRLFFSRGEFVAGVDESGVSDIAGPLIAACVVLPLVSLDSEDIRIFAVDDSKKIKEKYLEGHTKTILSVAIGVGIGEVSATEVDQFGRHRAGVLAMIRAIKRCQTRDHTPVIPDLLLIDGQIRLPLTTEQEQIVDGDSKSLSVASASIVAKYHRNTLMKGYHSQFPMYHWDANKGFPCEHHFRGLDNYGIQLGIHRTRSWPIHPDRKRDTPEIINRREKWKDVTFEQRQSSSLQLLGTSTDVLLLGKQISSQSTQKTTS